MVLFIAVNFTIRDGPLETTGGEGRRVNRF